MVPDTQDADASADPDAIADESDEDERGRLGRWGQHLLDLVEFVLDLF